MKITKARVKEIISEELEEIRKNPDLSPKRHKKPGEIKDDGKHADPKRARPQKRYEEQQEEELEEGEEEVINEELTRQDKTDVKKMVQDELGKLLKKKDAKDQVGEIVKKIMKKLYKDLSLEHPYIIDRIKI